jgi:transcriptional repressor NrdR
MQCPRCKNENSRVVDSRKADDGQAIRRRRECTNCEYRYTTFERRQETPILVVKKDGNREEFNREKLLRGVMRASEKRPVSYDEMEHLVEEVEREIRKQNPTEVPSEKIGDLVMDRLSELDEVAYIRFASVYRQFKDVDAYKNEVRRLEKRKTEHEEES